MKQFSIVAAVAANGIIGKNNKLPWNIPEDLEHFYRVIYGKTVVMGHKTYKSIAKPIKNSQNIVLSRNSSLKLYGATVVSSINNVLNLNIDNEVIVIGGESVYSQFLPFIDKMYLTFIDQDFEGDAYFPSWQQNNWEVINKKALQTSLCSLSFVILKRIIKK